jgi:hypothetical protein
LGFAAPGFGAANADHARMPCDHRYHASAHMLALHQWPPTLVQPEVDRLAPAAGHAAVSNPPRTAPETTKVLIRSPRSSHA